MPGFDGNGPLGQGPMTGRGMGNCVSTEYNPRKYLGLGRGQGRGIGAGRGLGRGPGKGMGRGFRYSNQINSDMYTTEK